MSCSGLSTLLLFSSLVSYRRHNLWLHNIWPGEFHRPFESLKGKNIGRVFRSSGFPSISVGKESACNAGDLSSIPGSETSTGEGIGYPLQYSWASLVAQPVKNLPAMQETCVQSLGWEDPLEKGKAAHSSILAWRIPWTVWSMWLQRVEHD